MNFEISRNAESLLFSDELPTLLEPYKVFPIAYTAMGSWGAVLFQVMITEDFTVWYSQYFINEQSSFTLLSNMEAIVLHITCRNQLEFITGDLGRIQIKEGQFNISYFPKINTTGHFPPGEYSSLDINYSKKYLNRFVPHLPTLEKFLHNIDNRVACQLDPTYSYAPGEMRIVINSILKYEYGSNMDMIYLECKVMELLTLTIQKLNKNGVGKFVLNKGDIDRMGNVKSWLHDNLDNPGSLRQIAKRFGINEYRLKRDFKAVYGVAVFEYILELRMERAKKLLLETNMPIVEIGYITGYSRGSHFTDAFKKHFKSPPTYFRKNA